MKRFLLATTIVMATTAVARPALAQLKFDPNQVAILRWYKANQTTSIFLVGNPVRVAFDGFTTVICTTIFENYGLGLYGKLQRWQLYAIVLGVWILQMAASPFWLRYYRFGPMEWLWRSLTYWKKQPMRRRCNLGALSILPVNALES